MSRGPIARRPASLIALPAPPDEPNGPTSSLPTTNYSIPSSQAHSSTAIDIGENQGSDKTQSNLGNHSFTFTTQHQPHQKRQSAQSAALTYRHLTTGTTAKGTTAKATRPPQSQNTKSCAPGEDRTHGLQIMRLTRCLLRYRGHSRPRDTSGIRPATKAHTPTCQKEGPADPDVI